MPRRGRGGRESDFEAHQRIIEQNAAASSEKSPSSSKGAQTYDEYTRLVREYQTIEKMIWDLESQSPEARKNVLQERQKELKAQLERKKEEAKAKGKELKKTQEKEKTLNRMLPSFTKFKARVGSDGLKKEKEDVAGLVEVLIADSKELDEGIDILKDQLGALKRDLTRLSSLSDELNSLKITQVFFFYFLFFLLFLLLFLFLFLFLKLRKKK